MAPFHFMRWRAAPRTDEPASTTTTGPFSLQIPTSTTSTSPSPLGPWSPPHVDADGSRPGDSAPMFPHQQLPIGEPQQQPFRAKAHATSTRAQAARVPSPDSRPPAAARTSRRHPRFNSLPPSASPSATPDNFPTRQELQHRNQGTFHTQHQQQAVQGQDDEQDHRQPSLLPAYLHRPAVLQPHNSVTMTIPHRHDELAIDTPPVPEDRLRRLRRRNNNHQYHHYNHRHRSNHSHWESTTNALRPQGPWRMVGNDTELLQRTPSIPACCSFSSEAEASESSSSISSLASSVSSSSTIDPLATRSRPFLSSPSTPFFLQRVGERRFRHMQHRQQQTQQPNLHQQDQHHQVHVPMNCDHAQHDAPEQQQVNQGQLQQQALVGLHETATVHHPQRRMHQQHQAERATGRQPGGHRAAHGQHRPHQQLHHHPYQKQSNVRQPGQQSVQVHHVRLQQQLLRQQPDHASSRCDSGAVKLLDMPDDILLRIVHCVLEPVRVASSDRIVERGYLSALPVASVCRRLQRVFHASLRDLELWQSGKIPADQLLRLARAAGPELKRIVLRNCDQLSGESLVSLAAHCSTLRTLDVSHVEAVNDEVLRGILVHRGDTLRSLLIRGCTDLTDVSLHNMALYASELDALDMAGLSVVTDAGMCAMLRACGRNLVSLVCSGCQLLTDASFCEIGARCANLEVLCARGLPLLSNDGVDALCRGVQDRLEVLDILNCDGVMVKVFLETVAMHCPRLSSRFMDGEGRSLKQVIISSLPGFIFHVTGRDAYNGRSAVYFLLVDPGTSNSFRVSVGNEHMNLVDYGTILCSCFGDRPNDTVRDILLSEYGLDLDAEEQQGAS